jgi:hypothetical protein
MADDVSRLIGRLEAGFEAVIDRVNRSDDTTAQKFRELADQHEKDKNLAISAREAKHAENLSRFQGLDEKVTTTYGIATVAYNWVTDKAPSLIDRVEKIDSRVKAIEDGKTVEAAEERGSLRTWGLIGGAITVVGGTLGGVLTYWDQIKDFLRGH